LGAKGGKHLARYPAMEAGIADRLWTLAELIAASARVLFPAVA